MTVKIKRPWWPWQAVTCPVLQIFAYALQDKAPRELIPYMDQAIEEAHSWERSFARWLCVARKNRLVPSQLNVALRPFYHGRITKFLFEWACQSEDAWRLQIRLRLAAKANEVAPRWVEETFIELLAVGTDGTT